jgi:hypothetical protein
MKNFKHFTWFYTLLFFAVFHLHTQEVLAYGVYAGTPVHQDMGGDQIYTQKHYRWNVTTNPFGFMLGTWAVGASLALNNHLAFHMDGYFIAPYSLFREIVGGGVSVGLPVFFEQTFHGWFLEPGGRMMAIENNTGSSKLTQIAGGPTMLLGWQKTWRSGLNLSLAFGGGYTWFRTVDGTLENNDAEAPKGVGFWPDGYFRVGYAF